MQHIGNDFKKQANVNLVPGTQLQDGIYQIHLTWISSAPSFMGSDAITYNQSSFIAMSQNGKLPARIGSDVTTISYTIVHLGMSKSYYCSGIRVSDLLRLSLADKFIHPC